MQSSHERTLYIGSGSPYSWRVWLALEHKQLPYELRVLSFSDGDLRKAEFAAVNPRCKVPVLDDAGFAIYESAAIVDYLDDAYRDVGPPLFPIETRLRAIARRKVREADEYVAHAMERLADQLLFTPSERWDAAEIAGASEAFLTELDYFDRELTGDYLVDVPGAADFTLYPLLALALRMEARKKPDLGIASKLGSRTRGWMGRIEALPYFAATFPPHWK